MSTPGTPPSIEALTFDVFGTVVDWRRSIEAEGRAFGRRNGLSADWAAFADDWRAGYQPAMEQVRSGARPWTKLDVLHREILDRLLRRFHGVELPEAEVDRFNRAWHRLTPWSDAVEGLERLERRFVIATLSNGNVSLLVEMAKRARLPWDVVLSAELAQRYKPDPATYRLAADLLGLDPGRVLMVAAHKSDLRAAADVGFRTAFVERPLEYGPDAKVDLAPEPSFDFHAADFLDLADQLGVE